MNTVNKQGRIIQRIKEYGNANYQQGNRRGNSSLYNGSNKRSTGPLRKNEKGTPGTNTLGSLSTGEGKPVRAGYPLSMDYLNI